MVKSRAELIALQGQARAARAAKKSAAIRQGWRPGRNMTRYAMIDPSWRSHVIQRANRRAEASRRWRARNPNYRPVRKHWMERFGNRRSNYHLNYERRSGGGRRSLKEIIIHQPTKQDLMLLRRQK